MPQFTTYTDMYVVSGTAAGTAYNGPVAFAVIAVPDQFNPGYNDLFPAASADNPWTAPFLAALAGVFDGRTFGDAAQSFTVTGPAILHIAETQTAVTPA